MYNRRRMRLQVFVTSRQILPECQSLALASGGLELVPDVCLGRRVDFDCKGLKVCVVEAFCSSSSDISDPTLVFLVASSVLRGIES